MSAPTLPTSETVAVPPSDRARALQIVAKSVYKELRQQGFDHSDVVVFASSVLGLISDDIRTHG